MNPINLYSSILLLGLLLLVAWRVVMRRKVTPARSMALAVLALALIVVWWIVRPVQTPFEDLSSLSAQIGAGQPVLLEFQSPY